MKYDFLHFCPSDGFFGDAMPCFAEGTYHIYYTKLYKNPDKSMSWGHIATKDFKNYTEYPDPFPAGAAGTPFNTGCVIYSRKRYYAFYAGADADGRYAMLRSESEDGISFTYPGKICFYRPCENYRQDNTWRDPAVFYDERCHLYRMVFCAKPPEGETPDCYAGVVGQAISEDLLHWECLAPLPLRGIATSIECPDLFFMQNRYILGHYWHETRFRSAPSMDGPWERGDVISPDHFDFMAAKQMCDGERHILVGWLPRKNCDCMERIWGGNMLIPRELTFRGKTPRTKFIRELDDWFPKRDGRLLPEKAILCGEGWQVSENGFIAEALAGGRLLCYPEMGSRTRIRFKMRLSHRNGMVICLLGGHPQYSTPENYLDGGYDLIFDASEGMLRLREHYMWDQRNDIAVIPCSIRENEWLSVDIVYDNNILEVLVDESQTMVSRLLKAEKGGFALSVQDTAAEFADFEAFLPQ